MGEGVLSGRLVGRMVSCSVGVLVGRIVGGAVGVLVGRIVGGMVGVLVTAPTGVMVSSSAGETVAVGATVVAGDVAVPPTRATGSGVSAGTPLGLHATSTRTTSNSGKMRFIDKVLPPRVVARPVWILPHLRKWRGLALKRTLTACERFPETQDTAWVYERDTKDDGTRRC